MEPRPATPADLPAVDSLLARSYPALLKADYPPSILVTALPLMSRAQPALLASGTYWVTMEGDTALACGGWTRAAPRGGRVWRATGHIRHVAADPTRLREGLARGVMKAVLDQAAAAGVRRMECMSTRTAVPFYKAMGFETLGLADVTLRPGIEFPAVAMRRSLPSRTEAVQRSS